VNSRLPMSSRGPPLQQNPASDLFRHPGRSHCPPDRNVRPLVHDRDRGVRKGRASSATSPTPSSRPVWASSRTAMPIRSAGSDCPIRRPRCRRFRLSGIADLFRAFLTVRQYSFLLGRGWGTSAAGPHGPVARVGSTFFPRPKSSILRISNRPSMSANSTPPMPFRIQYR
jgi:hypothetical protein